MTVTLTEFIETVFQPENLPEGESVCLAKGVYLEDKDRTVFPAYPGTDRKLKALERAMDTAWYWNVSTVRINGTGKVARRKTDCVTAYAVVLDDIGSKVKEPPVEPSAKVETSAQNFQWIYLIDPHDVSTPEGRARFEACYGALVDAGYSDDIGQANRLMRVPGSVNTKPGRDRFESRVTDWNPERVWSLDSLMEAFDVTPRNTEVEDYNQLTPREPAGLADIDDPVYTWLVENGKTTGEVDGDMVLIECPWADEHKGDPRREAKYTPVGFADFEEYDGVFKCYHAHCKNRGRDEFREWYELQQASQSMTELIGRFAVTKEDVKGMKRTEFIFPGLVPRGHLIGIVGDPGAGKTTIGREIATELAQAGLTVLYVNADISAGDVPESEQHSSEGGYHLLCPDVKPGLSMDDVAKDLTAIARGDENLNQYVVFIDTLKKMVDVISKQRARDVYKTLRSLTGSGATVICLAHTNKYAKDGWPVYEGTGDLRSDFDELVLLHPFTDSGLVTASLYWQEQGCPWAKSRAEVEPMSWSIDRLEGRQVKRLPKWVDTLSASKDQREAEKMEQVITAIMNLLRKHPEGLLQKEIYEPLEDVAERKVILRALKLKAGVFWRIEKEPTGRGKRHFLLDDVRTGF